ncbi:MAG: hypothetical protein HOW97_14575 [Catenulispora sp.]|nr:hypothetical protein [Catenulispora sp.]
MVELEDVRELAGRAFGEWALRKLDPEWTTERISHEPTRRLVTELGLPIQGPAHYSLMMSEDSRWPTVRDFFADNRPEVLETRMCTEFGHYLFFADLNGENVFLDPESGGVYWFPGPHETAKNVLVNSGVAEFLTFLAQIEINRVTEPIEALRDSDEDVEEEYDRALRSILDGIVNGVRNVDPAAFPADPEDDGGLDTFWYPWLLKWGDDDFAFDSWSWNRHAAEYFAAHGIDDLAEREPRHPVDLSQH